MYQTAIVPFLRHRPRLRGWHVAVGILAVAMWLVTIMPTGMDFLSLLVFVPPAAALGVFMRWLSCLFTPQKWTWSVTRRAALISALLLPPLLAALVAIDGLQRPEHLLPLFVLGAGLALGVGLLAAGLYHTRSKPAAVDHRARWLHRSLRHRVDLRAHRVLLLRGVHRASLRPRHDVQASVRDRLVADHTAPEVLRIFAKAQERGVELA